MAEQEATETKQPRWQARPVDDHEFADFLITDEGGNHVARVYSRFDGQTAKPARLMAASPTLLEALHWAHDRIHPPDDEGTPACAMTCPAHRAIAEAEPQP